MARNASLHVLRSAPRCLAESSFPLRRRPIDIIRWRTPRQRAQLDTRHSRTASGQNTKHSLITSCGSSQDSSVRVH
jgi:hypothetical protein